MKISTLSLLATTLLTTPTTGRYFPETPDSSLLTFQQPDIDLQQPLSSTTPSSSPQVNPLIAHLPSASIKCGHTIFTPASISAALSAGLKIVNKAHGHWKNKPREQPHWYNNFEGFDFADCEREQVGRMFEFPIMADGSVHPGGRTGRRARPGAHRVIFAEGSGEADAGAEAGAGAGTFCGLITHEGSARRGSFVACDIVADDPEDLSSELDSDFDSDSEENFEIEIEIGDFDEDYRA
jgi:hypothetical protein